MATLQEQNMHDYQTLQFDYLTEAEQMFGPKTEYEYSQQDSTKILQFDNTRYASKKGDVDSLQSWGLIRPKLLVMCRESA